MFSDTLFYRLRTLHRTESLFFYYPFFHTPHDLLASYGWPALSMRFLPLFFTGAPWPSVGAPGHWLEHWITFAVGRLEHPFSFFFFHNSITRPPPFFYFLLTTMLHGSNSVTTSLHCVGSPYVAVLCESNCPSSACVVQLERKKKKRVSVIVGNDH
jgi:hypothetical protein